MMLIISIVRFSSNQWQYELWKITADVKREYAGSNEFNYPTDGAALQAAKEHAKELGLIES